MKKLFEILGLIAVSLVAGAYLQKCQNPQQAKPPELPGVVVIDTIPYFDTIPFYAPDPVASIPTGYIDVAIPMPTGNSVFCPDTLLAALPPDSIRICASMSADCPDSLLLQLPVTQNIYEEEEYKAYVSGVFPKLDSIFVYAKTEVVTIREPPNKPKRWGIGVFAGYGYTPQGFQPCAGISINYNLWNF